MRDTLTISLPRKINQELAAYAKAAGQSRSAVVQEAVKRQLAVVRFQRLRARLQPKARAAGIYTDEDVFRLVS